MLFPSIIFLFAFLPGTLLGYYILLRWTRTGQNIFLCIASLFFYAWGEPRFVLVMILSIIVNYFMAILVSMFVEQSKRKARVFLVLDIVFNVTIIFIFKYLIFTLTNINNLFNSSIAIPNIALPIGISFFTFQAISYVVDVYKGKGCVQKNIINVGLYISLFPQLIAGPIVRYETIANQINNRQESRELFNEGAKRFIIGLAKKVLIANQMAVIADYAFDLSCDELSVSMAWLGAIAYTFQIFFDFAGYSDMAIGLGKMFGFQFLENFNYPYISKSATEFWRRWHISLGSWFRDYVYIPLGGSRVKTRIRHIFNLFIVWLCTGIWHGANWTFICWGLLYFILLVFEKFTPYEIDGKNPKVDWLKHIYTMFFVILGWVMFRADSISEAINYYISMFSINNQIIDDNFISYLRQFSPYLAGGCIFSTPIMPKVEKRLKKRIVYNVVKTMVIMMFLIISVSFIIKGSYSPFIYFNF